MMARQYERQCKDDAHYDVVREKRLARDRESARKYRITHKTELAERRKKLKEKGYFKEYAARNKEATARRGRDWYLRHIHRRRRSRMALKLSTLEAYGGCECVLCGDTDLRTLSLDHINNDGSERRKVIGAGSTYYLWLKRHGYPPGYQVLCMSCNQAKRFNGGSLPDDRKDLLRKKAHFVQVYSLTEIAGEVV
jgi:hypothetical protein